MKLSDRNKSVNFDICYCTLLHLPIFTVIFCCIYFVRTKYDKLKIGNYIKNKCVRLKHLIGYTCSTLRNVFRDNKLLYQRYC